MKFQVKDIDWCIEREDVEENLESLFPYVNTPDIDEYINELKSTLPTEVEVEVDDEEDIADYLSDRYGWLVNSFNVVNGKDDIWRKISALLMNTDEEHPIAISCNIGNGFGLSTNDMLEVNGAFQVDGDGTMWVNIYGMSVPTDMDDLNYQDLCAVYDALVEVCGYEPKLVS